MLSREAKTAAPLAKAFDAQRIVINFAVCVRCTLLCGNWKKGDAKN